MDASSYPALNEGFKEAAGTATVLIKAFMSIGAAILPVLIVFLISQDMFFGYAFFLPAILFIVLGIYFIPVRFPAVNGEERNEEIDKENVEKQESNPHSWKEGTAIVFIGFSAVSMTVVIQTWLPTFGQEIIHLNENNAVKIAQLLQCGRAYFCFTACLVTEKNYKTYHSNGNHTNCCCHICYFAAVCP